MKIFKKALCTVVPLCAALLLAGCHINISVTGTRVNYPNAEKYQAGETKISDTVNQVRIHWISGGVEVFAAGDKGARIEESGAHADEALKLRYWLDGDTLHIQPCASGTVYPGTLNKTLTLWLPKQSMDSVSVDSVSCDVEMTGLEANAVSIDTVSGDAELKGCTVTEELNMDSTSGGLRADLKGTLGALDFSTVSGDAELNGCEVRDKLKMDSTSGGLSAGLEGTLELLEFSSVSGAVKLEGTEIKRVIFDTTSGAMELKLEREPEELTHSTTSGGLSLTLPKNADFELEFDTVSGGFKSDIPFTKDGDTYIAGDGGNLYSVSTTSGDVKISAR